VHGRLRRRLAGEYGYTKPIISLRGASSEDS
jgi:hypothetical protein